LRGSVADTETVSRRLAVLIAAVVLFVTGTASGAPPRASFADPQIAAVVAAGLMAPSVDEFRPYDPLTETELASVLASLGMSVKVIDPYRPVTMRELNARLVSLVGLRTAAMQIRLAALNAGLSPKTWLGTEAVARMLGLRVNHERGSEALELQLSQPATRAEAAYSVARVIELTEDELETARETAATFAVPLLSDWQRAVVGRALRFVGSPYVWAGTSERTQKLGGKVYPGGFDCSGLVWRVYKLEPFAGAPAVLANVLRGRSSYVMSGEVPRSARIARAALQPGDVVFFGDRGTRSSPAEVGHMGIYVGNDWIVHSSRFGTTLAPLRDWYETRFAWGRRPLAEAGLAR
jgi:cell wall-associated NlpC family hydrolase